VPLGGAAIRPSGAPNRDLRIAEIIAAVQQEILPLDRSFLRNGVALERSFERVDRLWRELAGGLLAGGPALVDAREAAAMVATARWMIASATERRETRGINRRLDHLDTDPEQQRSLWSGGLDEVWVLPDAIARRALAS